MEFDLSPEEILKQREMKSGIKFDSPDVKKEEIIQQDNPIQTEKSAPAQPAVSPEIATGNSLGKSQFFTQKVAQAQIAQKSQNLTPGEIGWKNIPMEILPSSGLFYPNETKIAIRAASVKEIRHFSTIDEEDRLDIDDKLQYILDKCLRMEFPGEGVVSSKDIKTEDRFFLILAIRDLTFTKGENSVVLIPENECEKKECPVKNGFELRTGVLSSYDIDNEVFKHYSSDERCFIFDVKKLDKRIKMYIPSLGVTQKIVDFTRYCVKNKIEIDDSFLKIAPFIFDEWRNLSDQVILSQMRESDNWTKEEFYIYFELSERIKVGTKPKATVKCPKCGGREVTAEITFPRGIRSLFIISDIFRELL
jgi:hypothetical protein